MAITNISTISRRLFLSGIIATAATAAMTPHVFGKVAISPPNGSFRVRTPDGLTLAAQAQGEPTAPEILLIHGLGQSRLSWARQLNAPVLAGFRVVSFDLRGHGDSDKPTDEAAYADGARWADDLAAVIAAAGLRRPVLVGWSLGGLVILHYLKRHGNKGIAGINLVNAVTSFAPELLPDLLRPAAKDFAGRLSSEDFAVRTDAIAEFLQACFATPPPRSELDRMLVFNGMVPRAVQLGVVKISSEGFDEAIARFNAPLLVTFGAKDQLLYPKMAERVRPINPRAQFSIYPEAGHSPFYEVPGRFNRELAALVDRAAATR